MDGCQIQDGDPGQGMGWHVGAMGLRCATAYGPGLLPQASQHVGVVLSHIRGGSARLTRRVLEIHERGQGVHRAHARVMDRDHATVGKHRRMIHGLNAVTVGLSRDVAVLEINLHPLVRGFLQLLLQDFPAQEFPVFLADGGHVFEPLIFEQVPKANGLEMALDVRDPLIGVLQPCAVLGPHGNVSDGGEAAATGSRGKALRIDAPQLHIHQSAVTDIVVVGRGQVLHDTGPDPLSAPASIPHAQGGHDAAHRRLAGVPAARIHRRVHRAIPVGLSLQVEHPACLGGNNTLVPFDPAERPLLPKARHGAVDQARVKLRQGVIRQPPVRHVAGTEGFDQHVRLASELYGLLAAFCRVEIQHNAFLATVP